MRSSKHLVTAAVSDIFVADVELAGAVIATAISKDSHAAGAVSALAKLLHRC